MKASTHSIRLKRLTLLLVFGAIVAGTAATVAVGSDGRPTVQAGDRIVDDYFRDPKPVTTSIVTPGTDPTIDDYFRDPKPVTSAQPTGSESHAGLIADGLRWQGIARTYQQLESAQGHPTELGIKADGLRLQGQAQVYQQLQDGSGFDWGDWSIGLVAGFGLALAMAGALLLVVRRLPRLGKTGAPAVG